MKKFYKILIRILTTLAIYLFLFSIVFISELGTIFAPVCLIVAFFLSIPSTNYIIFKFFPSLRDEKFVSNNETNIKVSSEHSISNPNEKIKDMNRKNIISKGWMRLHLVISVLLSSLLSLIPADGAPHTEEVAVFIISLPIFISIYWIFVFVISWVIKGFKESK